MCCFLYGKRGIIRCHTSLATASLLWDICCQGRVWWAPYTLCGWLYSAEINKFGWYFPNWAHLDYDWNLQINLCVWFAACHLKFCQSLLPDVLRNKLQWNKVCSLLSRRYWKATNNLLNGTQQISASPTLSIESRCGLFLSSNADEISPVASLFYLSFNKLLFIFCFRKSQSLCWPRWTTRLAMVWSR